tara:strand:+ start:689 stop:2080 length:1392 start_codon:yes stop_codon:yes gene_type:complete
MADFIDIFGEDFSSVLASLDELPPEVETMLLGVMDKMVYDVRTFSNSLEKTVFSMSQAGMSEDMIKQTLANDMKTGGSIFGKLRNDTKASIVDGINQSAKLGQYQNYDLDKGEFAWVTVGGHRVCIDCDGRAGQKMTFAEWESEGLPGSGWSVCQGFCYCVLDPTGKASKKIDAPVKEPGKKVKPVESKWKPTMTTQEATKWNKKSQLQGILHHGASAEALEGIGKNGFDLSKRTTGRLYGDGAYFTKNTVVASGYGEGSVGNFMVNSKKHKKLLSDEFWQMQSAKVNTKAELTSGHEFLNKARMGALDDIAEIHAKKYKYENPKTGKPYTGKELAKARLEDLDKDWNKLEKQFVKREDSNTLWDPGTNAKWANYLESEYYKGNSNVKALIEKYADVGNMDDLPFMEEYGTVVKEFFEKEGYTSLQIDAARLPMGFNVKKYGNLTEDTYFIVFDPKNITKIID